MSRDRRMREGSSIAATKASAVSWPTPGMVISRRQAAEALVMRLMSVSIAATAVITAVRAAINPRMAAERPAIPSLALRALSMNAAVSARGSPALCRRIRRRLTLLFTTPVIVATASIGCWRAQNRPPPQGKPPL